MSHAESSWLSGNMQCVKQHWTAGLPLCISTCDDTRAVFLHAVKSHLLSCSMDENGSSFMAHCRSIISGKTNKGMYGDWSPTMVQPGSSDGTICRAKSQQPV